MRWADVRAMPLVAIALLSAACADSPTAPGACGNCKPLLSDLKMDTTYVLAPMTFDSARKRNILPPGNVKVVAVIENIGDTASLPGRLSILNAQLLASDSFGIRDFLLPSILPHAVYVDTVEVRPLDGHLSAFFPGSSTYFYTYADASNDGGFNNNGKQTSSFYLTKPTLVFSSTGVVTTRVNQKFTLPLTIKNDGYAPSPAFTVNGCLTFVYMRCGDVTWTSFPAYSIPALQPGQSYVVKDSIVVTPTSAFQDEQFQYTLSYCTTSSDPNLGGCGGSSRLVVLPDYESSCHPPVLSAIAPVHLNAFNCGLTAVVNTNDGSMAFHLVAIDMLPGHSYQVTRSDAAVAIRAYDVDGAPIDDLDPAADRFAVGTAGRYYIVSYDIPAAQTYSLVIQ